MSTPVLIAPRDASWWSNPNTSSAKVLHVVGPDGVRSACGNQVLDVDSAWRYDPSWSHRMCQRRACQVAILAAAEKKEPV